MPAAVAAPARTPTAPAAEGGPRSPANAPPAADRADIRPLDIAAALQILLAEVRAAFESLALALGQDASGTLNSPPQAARALLQMLLGAMPEENASMPAWNQVRMQAETALQTGLDRGIEAIIAWRDVPASVVDAAKETRSLFFSTLGDDVQNPAWLRPEWAGLAPRFERFWRRRRLARGHLTDPDYSAGSADDDSREQN